MLHIKKATALSLVLALSICLCACGTPAASTPNSSGASVSAGSQSGEYNLADATYVLKAGHVLAENHPYHQQCHKDKQKKNSHRVP